jgi:hypothetical protein
MRLRRSLALPASGKDDAEKKLRGQVDEAARKRKTIRERSTDETQQTKTMTMRTIRRREDKKTQSSDAPDRKRERERERDRKRENKEGRGIKTYVFAPRGRRRS